MGFVQAFMQILRRKPKAETLESALIKDEAMQQRSESFESLQQRSEAQFEAPQAIQSALITEEKPSLSIELQKDSIQLGLAAGYTGRTLREIESSLTRIESQIATKEWLLSQFETRALELLNLLKTHEEHEQQRFEALQNILNSLHKTAEKTPEPIKTELFQQIQAIERQLPLTPKMNELLKIAKESKEISYDELHAKLGISVSALRGLLTNMTKRTDQIERFEKDNKGWVRYTGI